MAIATLTIDINAKLASLEKDMGRAAHVAEQNAKRMESAFKGASRALGAIGAALSVGAFASMVKGVADAGDQLAKLSTKTGIAVEELSKLQYAASLSDVSNEDLTNSLGRLNKVLGEAADGSKEATEALARFGISPGTMNASEAFAQIADKVKNTSDQTKIASAMNDVFGKSWQTLVPLIKGGSEGLKQAGDELERMGGVFSGELAKASEEFNDNLTRIGKSLEVLKINSMGPVIQGLESLTSKFVEATKAAGGFWAGLATWGTTSGAQEGDPGAAIADLAGRLAKLQEMKKGLEAPTLANKLGFNTEDIAIVDKQISVITTKLEYLKGLNNKGVGNYQDRWIPQSVGAGITATPETPGKPKKDPKADLSQYEAAIDAEKAYFRAMEDIAKAQESARRSTLGLTAAQEKLLDLKQSPVWATLSEDQQRLAETQAKYADETIKASEAQERLNSLIDSLPSSQIERAWQDMELLNKALDSGKVSQSQYSEAVNKLFDGNSEKIEKQKTLAEELGMTFSSAFEDAIVKGNEFSDVLKGLAQDILRVMVRKNVTEPLTNALGSVKWGSLFSANADGGVYASPGLSSYSGTVVNRPTLFPFAKGIGLMGEAGAEAILPLKRGPDGKLGVGAPGGNVSVVVNNNANGTQATQSTRQDSNGDTIIEVLIEQVENRISSGVARGSGVLSSSLERVYGLNRAAGAF